MEFKFIKQNELEKFISMFQFMNVISNQLNEEFIESKMKRYQLVAKTFNYSTETIRKFFKKTLTYRWVNNNKYRLQIYYFDHLIFLNHLNNKRKEQEKTKKQKRFKKYTLYREAIAKYAKGFKNKISGKTLSGLLATKENLSISAKHIYFLVENNYLEGITSRIFPYLKYGKYYKKETKKTKRFIATPISYRDRKINERLRFGDVEIDTVEGLKSDNCYLSTMVDRKSRRLAITLYLSKSAQSFKEAVKRNLSLMLTNVLSITSDNGLENAKLDELNIQWFATNAYSSWQKGTIEQKHRQIRKFIPKGISMNQLTQEDCDLISLIINCETYLQSNKNSQDFLLGKLITKEELDYFFNLSDDEKTRELKIFNLV